MNVLVFCVDTLRRDHLPVYGYGRDTAPRVSEFGADALCFEDAVTPSTFTFSVASSMVSGLYPGAHGALSFADSLPDSLPVVPELLAETGYRTGVFAGMNYFTEEWGLARGFDRTHEPAAQDGTSTGERLVEELFDWPDGGEAPFSGVVWSSDAPKPYVETADTFAGHDNPAIDPYDNAIRYVDGQFGRVLDGLAERGLREETLVVFLADHGEVFDEHHWMESSRLARLAARSGIPGLADAFHEDQLGHVAIPPYEGALRIPLLVDFPDGPGGTTERTVQTLDLAPTVLEAANVAVPEGWQAHSIHPDAGLDRERTFALTNQTPGGARYEAARSADRKVVRMTNPSWENDTLKFYLGRRFLSKKRQAFDLADGERRTAPGPGHERLFAALEEHLADCDRLRESISRGTEVSEQRREHLEEMGYL
jgi:arylsulfatase A-like enzyme